MLGSAPSDLRRLFLSDPEVTSLLRLPHTTDDAEQTHFLNDSNNKNILSGTARLSEKRQFEQDCDRKNSHQGLKTQCLC